MNSANQPTNSKFKGMQEEVNFKKILSTYLVKWKWFALSLFFFILAAFLYLRYTPKEYSSYAKIMFVDNGTSGPPGAEILKDLRRYSETQGKKTEDEIEALKSRKILESVVKELKLNIQFTAKGRIHVTELYNKSPLNLTFIATDSIINISKFNFSLNILSPTNFTFKEEIENIETESTEFAFGQSITTPLGGLTITPGIEDLSGLVGQTIYVKIKPVSELAEFYKNQIKIKQITEYSNVIDLSLRDGVLERSRDIINTLIKEYNSASIEEKNLKSKNTADFIDERISLISEDLSSVDDKIERFKTSNKLTDITSEAELYRNSSSQAEQQISETQTQLNMINYMKNHVKGSSSSYDVVPSNVGLSDPSINNLASKYNDILRQRNSLLKGSTKSKNPIIINLDEQLSGLKQSLNQSLSNYSKTLSFQLRSLQNKSSAINSKIYQVPGQVRESKDIQREQGIKESLYLYLLQKREEATISLTSTSPNARIIDEAYSTGLPVFPKKSIVLLAAVILGLSLPFSIIYVLELLDDKIHNKEDLEKEISDITVLGEVPSIKGNDSSFILKNDRSVLSESFRIIRTNFDYIRRGRGVKKYDNIVFITSTINNEGKSFFSLNFALTIANTNKRVLVIGADIRNPKKHEVLNDKKNSIKTSEIGLTEYLVDDSIIIGESINSYEINGNKIDVMLSGKVPPNPAELLMSDRMKPLFDKVSEQYDYVIVDTAPSMLVTDTLLFSQYAGHTIYMTRAGYTEKRILNFAKELHDQDKLNGMMLVVNDVKQSNFGYGARYGYYGASEKKGWFKKKKA